MKRLTLLIMLAVVMACAEGTPAQADVCDGSRWCVEVVNQNFYVGLVTDEISIANLRVMQSGPEGEKVGVAINYLINHPSSRMYLAYIHPTPAMHVMQFPWNVGLLLKSGDIVWASCWIMRRYNAYIPVEPDVPRVFTPWVNETSATGHSYLAYLVFPDQAPDGKQWSKGKVEGLTIQ